MDAFKNYLKLFPHYSPELFDQLAPYISKQSISAKEYFLSHGKICKNLAFIEKGLVRLLYLQDGKEIIKCFCRENEITTSYASLISQTESDIAIQAVEDSELIILSYTSLQKLYEQHLFWQQLGRLASESELIRTEGHQRFLTDLTATERYATVLENDPTLIQRVPLNYLASYLQISPETLSRIRKNISLT